VNAALSATSGTAELELSTNSGDHRVRVAAPLAAEQTWGRVRRPRGRPRSSGRSSGKLSSYKSFTDLLLVP
jgi:hypothetical protein